MSVICQHQNACYRLKGHSGKHVVRMPGGEVSGCQCEECSRRKRSELRRPFADPCVYCGGIAFTIDHVVPRSRGGTNAADNRAPACRSCNTEKGNAQLLAYLARSVVTRGARWRAGSIT